MWKEYAVLVLVRHTAVKLLEGVPAREWPASPDGIAAEERLATAPVLSSIRLVTSSPEPKALATAQPLARRLGLEVMVESDLREVDRPPGPIVSAAEVQRRVRAYLADGLEGWEPRTDATVRVRACVTRLREGADSIAVVSHGLLLTLSAETTPGFGKRCRFRPSQSPPRRASAPALGRRASGTTGQLVLVTDCYLEKLREA